MCCLNQTVGLRGPIFNHDRKGQPLHCLGWVHACGPWQELAASQDLTFGHRMAISARRGLAWGHDPGGMAALTVTGTLGLLVVTGLRLPRQPLSFQAERVLSETLEPLGQGARTGTSVMAGISKTPGPMPCWLRGPVIGAGGLRADPNYQFGDLENLVRKARIDPGKEICFNAKDESRANSPEWRDFGSLDQLASRVGQRVPGCGHCDLRRQGRRAGLARGHQAHCSRSPVDLRNYKRSQCGLSSAVHGRPVFRKNSGRVITAWADSWAAI